MICYMFCYDYDWAVIKLLKRLTQLFFAIVHNYAMYKKCLVWRKWLKMLRRIHDNVRLIKKDILHILQILY